MSLFIIQGVIALDGLQEFAYVRRGGYEDQEVKVIVQEYISSHGEGVMYLCLMQGFAK